MDMMRECIQKTSVDSLVARRLGIEGELDRHRLEQAQLAALRRVLRHVLRHSSLYRERFAHLDPETVQDRRDLQNIPFLTSEDIVRQGHRLLSVSQSRVTRVITLQTSGSTGMPKRLSYTQEDLASTNDFFLHGMHSLIDQSDRVLVLLPFQQPASVGELLISALTAGNIHIEGKWPPQDGKAMADAIKKSSITCVVGLPQHLLAVSTAVTGGQLRSMLLCSDYASPALRHRIEVNCGCETFLHYGATESGLGGAVECTAHAGCHIRESDLLLEIINPGTGRQCDDGELGEVVLTTLGHEAMPLIRYRTGDRASLDRSTCICSGVSARLQSIRGRQHGCLLSSGTMLYSQDIDDYIFRLPGVLDYRLYLDQAKVDRLHMEYQAEPGGKCLAEALVEMLCRIPVIRKELSSGVLQLGDVQQVESFAAMHTLKRTIIDKRPSSLEQNAPLHT